MKKFFFSAFLAMISCVAFATEYPTRIYLCGPAGPGWATENWPMYTDVAEDGVTALGTYQWVGDLNDGDLKFLYGSSWEPGMAPTVNGEALSNGEHVLIDRPDGTYPDDKFAVTAGRYSLSINLTGEVWVLTVADGTGLADKNGDDQHFVTPAPAFVYPVGDGTNFGWNPGSADAIAKAEDADIYDGVVFLKNGEFKLMHQPDWGAQYGPVENGEVIAGAGSYSLCKPSDDNKWKIEGIDDLKPFHMIANATEGTLVLRDTTVVIPALTTLYMIGDAMGGWSFADNAVELNSEDSVFTYTGILLEGEFKYFEKADFGSQAWGSSEKGGTTVSEMGDYELVKLGSDDNKFYVMEEGVYTVVADLKAGVITFSLGAGVENHNAEAQARKMMVDGQLVIIKNNARYSVVGTKL